MSGIRSELEKRDILRLSNEESNKLTRECLQTALLLLMRVKPLEKITITELVARSGVSRSAFYRNYSSKEDILKDIALCLCRLIRQSFEDKKTLGNYEWYCNYFQSFKNNAGYAALFLNNDFTRHFLPSISALLEEILFKEISYTEIANIGAVTNITKYWLTKGMQESVTEMASICVKLLKE